MARGRRYVDGSPSRDDRNGGSGSSRHDLGTEQRGGLCLGR